MKKTGVLVGALVLVLLAVGPALAQNADLVILFPKEGDTIKGSNVTVRMQVTNFRIVDFDVEPMNIGENVGHIHIYLDTQPGNMIHTLSPVYVYGGLKPGRHTLTVELAHSNHTPLKEKVVKKISFQVE